MTTPKMGNVQIYGAMHKANILITKLSNICYLKYAEILSLLEQF